MMGYRRVFMSWRAVLGAVVVMCAASSAHADWIHGFFSPQAGIDSIERIVHVIDTKDSTYLGITIVPAGDINSDGLQDIILCRQKFQSTGRDDSAFIYLGGNPPSGVPYRGFGHLRFSMANIGDVNGDGYPDFGVQQFTIPDTLFVQIFYGGPTMDDSADFTIPNVFSLITKAADLDNDGHLELALGDRNQGFVRIYEVYPNPDTIPKYVIPDTSTSFGNNLVIGDFNGDHYPDLAVSAFLNRLSYQGRHPFVKFFWGGPAFDTIPDFQINSEAEDFGQIMVALSDFNGDGYGDIFISGGSNNLYGVYFGGPAIDTILDIVANWYDHFVPTAADEAGDINHDGYRDLVVGNAVTNLTGYVYAYLGGPIVDTARDVYMSKFELPGGNEMLGSEVRGVGDMNGDSIDDFAAFSVTQTVIGRGQCDVFAGWNSVITDVVDNEEGSLPVGCGLRQNYPNPFNPSTQIYYFTNRPGLVDVRVINQLGQTVKILVHEYLPPVSKTVQWNAMSDATPASSGVYYCRLSLDGVPQHSIKMLFVK